MSDDDTKTKTSTDQQAMPADLQAQLDALDGRPDVTDFPEAPAGNWASARRFHRVRKEPISIRLDADLLDWLRSRHEHHQIEINRILREYMAASR